MADLLYGFIIISKNQGFGIMCLIFITRGVKRTNGPAHLKPEIYTNKLV